MGEVAGFVLGIEVPGDAIDDVTGDTVWYEGVAEVAKRFQPRLAILFAGAPKPRGPSFRATMDNDDAIETANALPLARISARTITAGSMSPKVSPILRRASRRLGWSCACNCWSPDSRCGWILSHIIRTLRGHAGAHESDPTLC